MSVHAEDGTAVLELTEFEVTEEPMPDPRLRNLPSSVQRWVEELTEDSLKQDQDGSLLREVESLVERYPQIPRLWNLLGFAYDLHGDWEKAAACVEETYRRFPDYVFGVSNWVRDRLQEGELDEAGRALNGRFLITQFAPGRKKFHVSEVVAYQGTVGEYLAMTRATEAAQRNLEMVQEMAPDHPQVRRLAARLAGGPFRRMLAGLGNAQPS
jgi:tetratricopeptide (TPR) repeat protein